ncbi:MAG: carboxypeptidase regulatory-like domain-containing protein [Candidatus Kerfeldbacteria bacterium]|nr:carboxypeptidase regulatory-like domain-containing protein [Candidatus Kerfeldbacteria bacterium]
MKRFLLRALVGFAAVVAGVAVLHAPQALAAGTVSGTVKESNGTTAVANASVTLRTSDYMSYYWASTDTNGAFSFSDVTAGSYTISVWAYHATENSPADQTVTVSNNQTSTVSFTLIGANVTFRVTTTLGVAVPNLSFSVHNADYTFYDYGTTDSNGNGSTAVTANGTYTLEFYSGGDITESPPANQTFTYSGSTVALGTLTTRAPSARIKVVLPDGSTAAQNAWVQVHDASWTWGKSWSGNTDATGIATVGTLDAGTYTVEVDPPYSSDGTGYISPADVSITISSGSTNTVYETTPIRLGTASKTITGTVSYANGTAVTSASYYGYGIDNNNYFYGSATNGTFTISTGPGKYEIMIYNTSYSGSDWGYTGDPKRVKFEGAAGEQETVTVAFTVSAFDATITGTLKDSTGSLISGWPTVSVFSENVNSYANPSQTDGSFSVPVPAGTYQLSVWGLYGQEGPPSVDPITINAGETLALGEIRTRARTATITGTVSDRSGTPLANKYVNLWSECDGYDKFGCAGEWGWAQTGSDGSYTIYVTGGTYMVDAMGGWDYSASQTSYINTQGPQRVTVAANSSETVNHVFAVADSTIQGTVVDGNGTVLENMYGWVEARISGTDTLGYNFSSLGGPVSAGTFTFAVAGGLNYTLNVWTPQDSDYSASSGTTVTVAESTVVDDAQIVLLPNDVTVTGTLVDADGTPVEDSGAMVFATNGAGTYRWADVEDDGTYEMDVSEGDWNFSYSFGQSYYSARYIPDYSGSIEVTGVSGQTITQDLAVIAADGEIQVTITNPAGEPVANVWVSADTNVAGNTTSEESLLAQYDRGGFTDADGEATIFVPEDTTYYITAHVPPSETDVMAPASVAVMPDGETAESMDMQFVTPDVTVSGTVDLGSTGVDGALVWAWSDDGRTASASTDTDGSYSLDLVSGTTWHYGVDYDDGTTGYEVADTELTPEADTDVSVDLPLDTTTTTVVPDEVTQTFGAENQTVVDVEDASGDTLFTLSAPARSVDSGSDVDVSLTVTPTVEAPEQAENVPVGTLYDVNARTAGNSGGAEITTLDGNVSMTMEYDPTMIPDGVTEDELTLAYFDTSANTWRSLTNITIDTDANTISGLSNHFTLFGVVSPNGSVDDQVNDTPESGDTPDSGDGDQDSDGSEEDDTPAEELPDEDGDGEADADETAFAKEYILLTPASSGAPLVRVVESDGAQYSKFYAYGETLRGGFRAMNADIDGDGTYEILTVTGSGFGPQLRAFETDGTFIADIFTHDEDFRSGLNAVVLDMNGDGKDDVAVAPLQGSPNVRVYTYDATNEEFDLLAWKMVYDSTFRGGVNLAKADINGGGSDELITAPRVGSPNVRVYQLASGELSLHSWFWAYDSTFRGGVNPAGADVNGGGNDEIVTVPAAGASNLRVYRYLDNEWTTWDWVFAFGTAFTGGTNIVSGNIDLDAEDEIIVSPAQGGGANVRTYEWVDGGLSLKDWGMVYDSAYRGGVNLALVDTNQNGDQELVVAPTAGHTSNVRVYNWNGARDLVNWFWGFSPRNFFGGVNVGS